MARLASRRRVSRDAARSARGWRSSGWAGNGVAHNTIRHGQREEAVQARVAQQRWTWERLVVDARWRADRRAGKEAFATGCERRRRLSQNRRRHPSFHGSLACTPAVAHHIHLPTPVCPQREPPRLGPPLLRERSQRRWPAASSKTPRPGRLRHIIHVYIALRCSPCARQFARTSATHSSARSP
jgi:hypothetical protein